MNDISKFKLILNIMLVRTVLYCELP